jgi:bleomycin hydrolase
MKLITLILSLLFVTTILSQEEKKSEIPHQFEIIKKVEASTVKSQGNSSTCWAFGTTSFIEAELIRMGKGELDISEMFFIRKDYPLKANRYVNRQGLSNFGPGGLGHDAMNTIRECGMMPESYYGGKLVDSTKYNHSEMHGVLESVLKSVVGQKSGNITPLWKPAFNSILDVYLGEVPTKFEFEGKEYTPKSFKEYLEFDPDNYIEFTSYIDIPFYEKSVLDIPDNWIYEKYFNIPMNDLISLMDNSIDMGYSFLWDGDAGRDYFYRSGYAVIPVEGWDKKDEPEQEKVITQKMRQEAFNSQLATDDHLMHITGVAKNQNDTKFYYTKNSWGNKGFDGYWYMSESYVKLMTVSIMVHKDVIPEELKTKLGI